MVQRGDSLSPPYSIAIEGAFRYANILLFLYQPSQIGERCLFAKNKNFDLLLCRCTKHTVLRRGWYVEFTIQPESPAPQARATEVGGEGAANRRRLGFTFDAPGYSRRRSPTAV